MMMMAMGTDVKSFQVLAQVALCRQGREAHASSDTTPESTPSGSSDTAPKGGGSARSAAFSGKNSTMVMFKPFDI